MFLLEHWKAQNKMQSWQLLNSSKSSNAKRQEKKPNGEVLNMMPKWRALKFVLLNSPKSFSDEHTEKVYLTLQFQSRKSDSKLNLDVFPQNPHLEHPPIFLFLRLHLVIP